jgi:hypothetical protein
MGLFPRTAPDRAKTAEKPGPLEDNRSPARLTPPSESDDIPQVLEIKGFPSIGPAQFECAKPFDDPLRSLSENSAPPHHRPWVPRGALASRPTPSKVLTLGRPLIQQPRRCRIEAASYIKFEPPWKG